MFSAEVSAADAVLFMLATSLSQDLYRRLLRPSATDRDVLRVARMASAAGGGLAVVVLFVSHTIIDALSVFYATIRGRPLPIQLVQGGRPIGVFTPSMCGLAAAGVAFGLAGLRR